MRFIKSMLLGTCLILNVTSQVKAQSAESVPAATENIDPAKLKAASELIETIMPAADREKMMQNMLTPMMNNMMAGIMQNPDFQKIASEDPSVKNIFEKFIERQKNRTLGKLFSELPNMTTAMSKAYARQFSLQEMADAKAFFITPSGKAYMTKAAGIGADEDIAKWQRNWMASFMSDQPAEMKLLMDDLAVYKNSKSKKMNRK